MDIFIQALIFLTALTVLIKSSDYFVDTAERIGKWLNIPSVVIGVTIVALGTSLPELVTAIIAVYKDSSEIVLGNVAGSNVANVLLILGVSALFTKAMEINWNIFYRDLPMFFVSAMMFCFVVIPFNKNDYRITLGESILLLLGYLAYMFFAITEKEETESRSKRKQKIKSKKPSKPETKDLPKWIPMVFVASMVGIFLGAQFTIDSVITTSTLLEKRGIVIGKDIIAITAVAIGTSLPELMVSVSAVRKGKFEIAFGNVAGSNIFNTFAVIGIPGIFASIKGTTIKVTNDIEAFAMPFMIFTYLVFLVVMMDKKITRMEGVGLLLCYALFIGKLLKFI